MNRRWPPIVAAVLGAVLVFLVLPNPLSIPQTNPSASAEYAPVPGKQETAETANFAETNEATSAGVGADGEGIGALPGIPPPKLPEFNPRQKNCVGNPPRQTEDPISPPCVPFFEGNNGGKTFKGVDKDTITIVLYNDRCCEGDLNKPWKPSDEGSCTYPWDCENIVRTVKALHRYFNRRFQLYGRQVRLYAVESTGDVGGSCASRRADAKTTLEQYDPFAVVSFVQGGQNCYFHEMSLNKIPVFGNNEDAPQHLYEDNRPYAYGFLPTQEVQARWSASFICRKLVGGNAIHTQDPLLRGNPRKIGFIRPDGDSRGDELRLNAEKLVVELERQCNYEFDEEEFFSAAGTGAGSREAGTLRARFKQEGVTTLVCYCIPRPTELTVGAMQKAASGVDYYPEWYWDVATAMDRGIWQRMFGSPEHPSFGSTYYWRAPAFREQYHYRAYLEEQPGTEPSAYWSSRIYNLFINLYSGIQAAGPNLTPASVEQGMFTFNYTAQENVWVPTGGYGPYNDKALSDYTFVDSASAWWWDPTGTPPGGAQGEGCIRAVRGGLRVYPQEWPKGDKDLFNPEDPCTQDHYKVKDPNNAPGA